MNIKISSFYKSQSVSLIATAVDFLMTLLFKEIVGIFYIAANAIGLISGGFIQFTLNRRWTFKKDSRTNKMILRFLLVWMLNFLLNTTVVWCLTDFLQWDFLVSKVATSTVMAVSINFFLQKEYVFK
ncbi:GtrA family protein [Chryseobacterium sp. Ch-15]|uniref:GtrA family protein n=1 Tax=Chryseobacterium muglaense TaxID=2893752 RepID=A0A9Q3YUU4_9FLAO|nr:GtrA family protein [Chryseobacterium muglaense]MBD3903312.1 GtrA family protein [Chryseobacterium muglaense]MCC9036142.1 GtrA family protein [Chryseobacterium muglaense]MCM2553283.1 GtrA family protein [Chryseobacterium muglaense]